MKALTVYDTEKMEVRDVQHRQIGPREILLSVGAVGLCGTDFHIYQGHANYNVDGGGRPIPLTEQAQILGHEFAGTVAETGQEVRGLHRGDRVTIDQGLNCSSRDRTEWCEYCATGSSHQCLEYAEYGITGEAGALAEFVVIPGVNAIRIEGDLSLEHAALTEPLGCVIHSLDAVEQSTARYRFGGERPVSSVLIVGAGPAGLLFTQYLRRVVGFDGLLIVSEPNSLRRGLASEYGATTIDPTEVDLVEAARELTHGERIHLLIEAAGHAPVFRQMPGLIRKQATILLYGHGQHGEDLGILNNIQFLEPTLVSPVGASGTIDADGRPRTYRRALELLSSGQIEVAGLISHRYHRLEDVPTAFSHDRFETDYIKGLAVFA
ncbi:MAG: alcohol dehydrogenase catalytic domain-containing protein [Acidobacteriota bacterium]